MQCTDDITGKELLCLKFAMLEIKLRIFLRDLRVHDKFDEREAVAQYYVTPVDTKWIDTNKSSEGIMSRIVAREFKVNKKTFSIMRIDVSRAYWNGRRRWGNWSVEEEYVRHTGRSKQLGA